jgi:hypothetical protein
LAQLLTKIAGIVPLKDKNGTRGAHLPAA